MRTCCSPVELGPRPKEETFVRGGNKEELVDVVLDSGADVSVLPMTYSGIGQPLTGRSILRDAQGRKMGGGELRRAVVVLQDGQGNEVQLKETSACLNVKEPLIGPANLIKHGWKVVGDKDKVKLSFGTFDKEVQFRDHSLVTGAVIRRAEASNVEEPNNTIRTVTMHFEGLMRDLVITPGWHVSLDRKVPFVVTLNTKNYQDSRGQVDRLGFPYRSTIIFKNHVWEIVEVVERSDKEDEIEECQGVDEPEMGLQQHAPEGDPMPLVRAEESGEDFEEIEVDGEKLYRAQR